LDADKNS
jgi:hypothetical protein